MQALRPSGHGARPERRRGRHHPYGLREKQASGHPPAPLPLTAKRGHDPPQAHRGDTPARTLADLRRALAPEQFRKAVRQAEFLGLDLRTIRTDGTRSEAEGLFLRICRRHRIARPEVNARIGRYTVDFLWPEQRLVVETDGYVAHRGKQAFEDDRARELDLHALGYRVRRFTYRQVRDRRADRSPCRSR
jgi:very-short-patch-repair endonuclease